VPTRKSESRKASKPPAKTSQPKAAPRGKLGVSKNDDGLTLQQRKFVIEYAKDNNATQAALRAGYARQTARQQGSRLLTQVVIKAAIVDMQREVIAKVQADTGITIERTLREIARLAFFDPRKLFDAKGEPLPLTELDDDTAAAIAGLDVLEEYEGAGKDRVFVGYVKKWKLADKNSGLDKLMKHLGGYREDNAQQATPLAEALQQLVSKVHGQSKGLPFKAR
jgi:phage terminase small subunit